MKVLTRSEKQVAWGYDLREFPSPLGDEGLNTWLRLAHSVGMGHRFRPLSGMKVLTLCLVAVIRSGRASSGFPSPLGDEGLNTCGLGFDISDVLLRE